NLRVVRNLYMFASSRSGGTAAYHRRHQCNRAGLFQPELAEMLALASRMPHGKGGKTEVVTPRAGRLARGRPGIRRAFGRVVRAGPTAVGKAGLSVLLPRDLPFGRDAPAVRCALPALLADGDAAARSHRHKSPRGLAIATEDHDDVSRQGIVQAPGGGQPLTQRSSDAVLLLHPILAALECPRFGTRQP